MNYRKIKSIFFTKNYQFIFIIDYLPNLSVNELAIKENIKFTKLTPTDKI